MKRTFFSVLAAIAGFASLTTTAQATRPYTDGDLLLGVRASSDPGSTQDYVLNLGAASQFTTANGPFTVSGLGNVATDLAIFSEAGVVEWHSRPEVFWSIVGTDLAGDPANTLYVTRPRATVTTQSTPWTRRSFSTQSATNSVFRSFISGYTLSDANAASPRGTIQSTSSSTSYANFTSGGTDFGAFSGIEGNFGAGTAGSILDLYRLTPTTQNPSGEGLLFVGTFQFSNTGTLTFTPAPPVAPNFRFSSPTYTVNENAGTASITVVRGGLVTGADTVQFDTSNGTALAGTDYTAKNSFTVNFAANETSAIVTVDVTEVAGVQPNRSFQVALSNPSAGQLASPSTSTVTLTDSTPQNFGQLAFSSATYSFTPLNPQGTPNTLAITIDRTGGSDGDVSADLSVTGGSLTNGTDFTALAVPTTVNFTAGQTTKTVNIQLLAVADTKLPGTINLSLTNAQGATLGATTAATVNVTAKDKIKPSLKLTTKSGKVLTPIFQVAGTAKDNSGVDRVHVQVNGGSVQLATLGAPSNGSRSIDLSNIQLENGKNTIVVTAFDTSGNATKSTTLKVTYTNLRPALAGSYNGLFTAAGAATNSNTGFVTATVTASGLFSGKVTIGEAVLPIKGIFDNAGVAHFNATGDTTAAPIALALSKKTAGVTTEFGQLALAIATDKVTGTLKNSGGTVLANLDADRAFFDGKTNVVTSNYLATKGNYTVIFPARATQVGLSSTDYPQGDGAGTLKLTAKGVATLKGTLADGTPITAAAPLSKLYRWPLFAKLYKKKGVIAGFATFDDTATATDLLGQNLVWIRPADAKAKHYPAGWASILIDVLGSKYDATGALYSVPTAAAASVLPGLPAEDLNSGNANLGFFDGKLTGPVTKTVNISPKNKVTNAPADKSFSLKITAATGLIQGKFPHTDSSSPAFKGALFQKGSNAAGYGYFLSTVPAGATNGESGAALLEAK